MSNSLTTPEELAKFAQSRDPKIRQLAAKNYFTSPQTLESMVDDLDEEVLFCLAQHPYLPEKPLFKLTQNPNPRISNTAKLTYNSMYVKVSTEKTYSELELKIIKIQRLENQFALTKSEKKQLAQLKNELKNELKTFQN